MRSVSYCLFLNEGSAELTLKGAKAGAGTCWEGCMTEDSDGPERGLNRPVSTQWRGEWGTEKGKGE